MSGFYTTQSEKMPFQVSDKHVGWEHTLWLYTCSDGQTSSGTREPVSFPAGGSEFQTVPIQQKILHSHNHKPFFVSPGL